MRHLRLTHFRLVFHYKVYCIVLDPEDPCFNIAALHDDEGPTEIDTPRETDLLPAAARLFDAIPTLQHVFLTTCGRTWVWVESYMRLRDKWCCSKGWRAAGDDKDLHDSPGPKRSSCVEISGAEAEAVMDREGLRLSQREEVSLR